MDPAEAALRFLAILETGELDGAEELIAEDYVNHEAASARAHGPDGFRGSVTLLRTAFEELRFEIDDVFEAGGKAVIRCRMTGRHVGEYLGVAATGRRFSAKHIHIWRVQDGRVREHWACRDDWGMMRELGVLPPRQAA